MEDYNGANVEQIAEHDLISKPHVSELYNVSRMAVCQQCCKPTHANKNREATKKVEFFFGLNSFISLYLCDKCADRKVRHYHSQGLMIQKGIIK